MTLLLLWLLWLLRLLRVLVVMVLVGVHLQVKLHLESTVKAVAVEEYLIHSQTLRKASV